MITKKKITIAAALLLAFAQHLALADSATETRIYTIKQSAPPVGSNMKHDIVNAGTIPLNKPYADLTDTQKATIRDQYDHMPAADEPPFPERGLLPIYKAIGNAHENTDYENLGPFSMEVNVDSEGNPKSVDVLTSPSEDISTAAVYAAMHLKYKPAVCGGQPCTMKFPIHAELISPGVMIVKKANLPGMAINPTH